MIKNRKFIYLFAFILGGGLFYFFAGMENKILSFILGSFLFLVLAFFYLRMNNYIRECFNDLINKVTWPTWKELQNSSIVVAVASLIIAGIIYLMDSVFSRSLDIFYNIF